MVRLKKNPYDKTYRWEVHYVKHSAESASFEERIRTRNLILHFVEWAVHVRSRRAQTDIYTKVKKITRIGGKINKHNK